MFSFKMIFLSLIGMCCIVFSSSASRYWHTACMEHDRNWQTINFEDIRFTTLLYSKYREIDCKTKCTEQKHFHFENHLKWKLFWTQIRTKQLTIRQSCPFHWIHFGIILIDIFCPATFLISCWNFLFILQNTNKIRTKLLKNYEIYCMDMDTFE